MDKTITKLHIEYEKFLNWELEYQKQFWKFSFNNLYIITWLRSIENNYCINYFNLPILKSYKTSCKEVISKWNQIFIKPEKFLSNLREWIYFDVYGLNNKFYWYSIEDYFILTREFWKVFVNISIENLYKWLVYDVNKIFILDYDNEIFQRKFIKRIKEKDYSEEKIKKLYDILNYEKSILQKIKDNHKYKNIFFVNNINELKNCL